MKVNMHSPSCCCNSTLYTFKECPDYLTSNPFITRGYRVGLTHKQCLQSIFICSNELINIWSHLLGGILFIYFLYEINFYTLPRYINSQLIDHMIVSISCICFISCLFFSAMYHIFSCKSKKEFNFWLKLDLLGITLSLWGCYIPAFYYGFYCNYLLKVFYTASILLLMIVNILFQLCSRHVYTQKKDYKRILLFCVITIFGIVPSIHWYLLLNGFSNPLVKLFIPKIMKMYSIAFLSFTFYMTKFPEKIFPGWFNYIGSSHQCWHIFILYAFYYWYNVLLVLLDVRIASGNDSCKLEIIDVKH